MRNAVLASAVLLCSLSTNTLSAEQQYFFYGQDLRSLIRGQFAPVLADVDLEEIFDAFLLKPSDTIQTLSENETLPRTGIARILSAEMNSIQNDILNFDNNSDRDILKLQGFLNNNPIPVEAPKETHPLCIDEYKEKVEWLNKIVEDGGTYDKFIDGVIAFGKFETFDIKSVPTVNTTDPISYYGSVVLCSWVGDVNYRYNIEFENYTQPAPGPILQHDMYENSGSTEVSAEFKNEFSFEDQLIEDFEDKGYKHKLHAAKQTMRYTRIYRNSELIPRPESPDAVLGLAANSDIGSSLYTELEGECFDIFYKKDPSKEGFDLDDYGGYCLSLCDMRVINTGPR